MNGYLLINKPKGLTSHDVIYRVRKIAKTKKVGHTGTLDPMATGLMVVCIGTATKAADYITNGNKAYVATMKLGFISDTLDSTGEVTPLPKKEISEEEIRKTFDAFLGTYEQVPPMYSAKKIDGKKLYEMARKGETIERKPVSVSISKLEIQSINKDTITFYVECSKGTYIRSLIDDIGKQLNYGAIMTDLKRVKSGQFSLDSTRCHTLEELEEMDNLNHLLYPVDTAFTDYPKYTASAHFERLIKNGILVDLKRLGISHETQNGKRFRVYSEDGIFFAVMEVYQQAYLKLRTTFFSNGES